MKTDTRHRTTFGTRFRFLVRVLALLGVLAAAAGAVVAAPSFPPSPEWSVDYFQAAAQGEKGTYQQVATLLLAGGAATLALWLLVELLSALTLLTGRKTASGTNAAVQAALAAALLFVVNAISFNHYKRWDNTRDKEFTIAPELREKLAKLDPKTPTTIIAVRVHKTASVAPDRSDNYDAAAERKVVEKVRDLTDVLREFGPTFDVRVLDIEDEDYAEKVKAVAGEDAPFVANMGKTDPARKTSSVLLTAAIQTAPENSIFFAANGKFQRMGFNEFLLYDKTASKAEEKDAAFAAAASGLYFAGDRTASKAQRNLVLVPQGADKFVEKLLSVEARKPVVGLAVIHRFFTSRSDQFEEINAAGLRAALERNGFEVRDVVLKTWGRQLSPAARSYDEAEFLSTEGKFNFYTMAVSQIDATIRRREVAAGKAEKSIAEMNAALRKGDRNAAVTHLKATIEELQPFSRRRILDNGDAELAFAAVKDSIPSLAQELTAYREKLDGVRPKYEELLQNDRLLGARRTPDVKARFQEFVDSCDLLIVPRMTVRDLSQKQAFQAWLFNWSQEQVDAIQGFVARGKPVMFALGASAVDKQRPGRDPVSEAFDEMLSRFGITLGEQAVFTDTEGEALAEAGNDQEDEGFMKKVKVPPVRIVADGARSNPVAGAFVRSVRVVDGELPVRRSGFQPIYLSEQARARSPFVSVLASTDAKTWNEERPIADDDYTPRFTAAKLDDPAKGTRDEKRRGPFDVGVALEAPVPADWLEPRLAAAQAASLVAASGPSGIGFPIAVPTAALPPELFAAAVPDDARPKPPTVRLVVLGHGGLFTGPKLEPGEEALLLHSLNWQLRRDAKLPQAVPEGKEWKYPRVALDPVQKAAWTGGAVALLPLCCAVLGVVVLMIRRFR